MLCETLSVGCIFPDVVWNDCNAFETSVTPHPSQECHIIEDLNLQQHCCYTTEPSHYTVSNVSVT